MEDCWKKSNEQKQNLLKQAFQETDGRVTKQNARQRWRTNRDCEIPAYEQKATLKRGTSF